MLKWDTFTRFILIRTIKTTANKRNVYKTHYQILNVSKNCSAKEIRDAFLKLSKKHHPDINKGRKSHENFQLINEAYKVLGKPDSRRNYDLGLPSLNKNSIHSTTLYKEQMRPSPWDDPAFYRNRDRTRDAYYESKSYYGINGVKRVSNGTIVFLCSLVTVFCFFLQMLAVNNSFTFQREELKRKSDESFRILNETRDIAHVNGNQEQIDALRKKLLRKDSY